MKTYKPYKIQYYIGIRKRQEGILEESKKFHIINNPLYGWCADPFLFECNGHTYVFAEKWDYIKQKGVIVYTEIKRGRFFHRWKTAIEEPYHLSYPNIWRDQDGIHICTESCASREIYTYTAVQFPDVWRKDKVWWRGNCFADTTILFNEKNMPEWLFTYGCSELVTGKLFRIRLNTDNDAENKLRFVTRDARMARPGGRFIIDNGRTFRIAQNCSESYGRSLSVCEITECTEQSYKEKYVFERSFEHVKTDRKINKIGMHTYNRSKQYEVVDFRVKKLSLFNMLFYILKKIMH